ncbi:MAG: hypothetical protein HZA80_00770 [Candidatus Taylorbacteria bacterium]|nr:hypothetical protein [Candidatus Taylorbacteria bacterium]
MAQKGSMSAGKWFILYVISGFVDLLQIILDFFAIGIVINRVIDIFLGLGLPIYLHLNGIPMFETKNLMLYISVFIGEEIPLVDALPLWTFEVWRMHKNYITSQLTEAVPALTPTAQAMSGIKNPQQTPPLNKDGVRQPPQRQRVQQIKVNTSQKQQEADIISPDFNQTSEKSSDDDLKEAA